MEGTGPEPDHAPVSSDDLTRPAAHAPPPVFDTALPTALAGYTFTRELHRGGQGVVYQAIQQSTKRKVAVKVMREGPFAGPGDKIRFEREVEVLARLNHPNIVAIHDSGVAAGCHYFVMDYISGQPLDEFVLGSERPVEEILRLFLKICEAVNAAHLRGVVHRDLKPGNIRVDQNGEPHILDFGLAKVATGDSSGSLMTITGQFMGSLPWASPEQAEALPGKIDVRSDVYSLGVVLYQMLTGRFPYDVTGNMRDVLDRIINEEPTRPTTLQRRIRDDVETIVLKCLQKDRDRRYQSAGDLARDIRHYLSGEPIEARRDSVLYVMRTRSARIVREHPAATCLVVVAFAALLAHWVGVPLIYRWTPANSAFMSLVAHGMPACSAAQPFQSVRVIALSDDTDLDRAAEAAGLDPQQARADPRALRRVHGRLMESLADAGVAVVAWDIQFAGDSPYDEAFAAGVRAVRDAGGSVVVGVNSWTFSPEGVPPIGKAILNATRWGCTPTGFEAGEPWRPPLAVQRGLADPLPSLALMALAAYRHPDAEFDLRLDPLSGTLNVVYWRPSAHDPRAKTLTGEQDEINLSAVRRELRAMPQLGIRQDDLVAHYILRNLPTDDALEVSTLDYAQAFEAGAETLRAQLGDRIAIVGDQRGGAGFFAAPDGRRVWGTYAHATAIDVLLHDAPLRIPTPWRAFALTLLAAAVGHIIGWRLFAARWSRRGLTLVAAAAIVALSFLGAWHWRALYNPLIAVSAMVVAGELSAAVHQVRLSRRA